MNIEAHAKINLSLDIVGVREDGYHLVKMVMQALELHDDITLEKIPEKAIRISITDERGKSVDQGAEIPVDQNNLMYKAANVLLTRFGIEEGICMHLTKRIPAAAGLAGGSADAAAVMRGVNELFELGLSNAELREMGVKLGADIPYCILGGAAVCEGIGEVLTPVDHKVRSFVLLVKPAEGLSTPVIYKAYDRAAANNVEIDHPDVDAMHRALLNNDCSCIYAHVGNVLEYAVVPEVPLIETIKQDMLDAGAKCSRMTGSGSTVFGLFEDAETMHQAAQAFQTKAYRNDLSDIVETRFQ